MDEDERDSRLDNDYVDEPSFDDIDEEDSFEPPEQALPYDLPTPEGGADE